MIRREWLEKLLDKLETSMDEAVGNDELTILYAIMIALDNVIEEGDE